MSAKNNLSFAIEDDSCVRDEKKKQKHLIPSKDAEV